jgi:hypothetical protein
MRTHVPNGPSRNAKSSWHLILMLAAFFTTGVVAPVQAKTTAWFHNGSTLELNAEGRSREFHYS